MMRLSRVLLVASLFLLTGSVALHAQAQEPAPDPAAPWGEESESAPAGETPEGTVAPEESGTAEEGPEAQVPIDPFAEVVPVDHCGSSGFHASSKEECTQSCQGGSHYVAFLGCCYCE